MIPVILIFIGFVAQMLETKYLMTLGEQGVGLKLASWVYSAGMVMLLFSSKVERLLTKENSTYRLLVQLGTISFGVYLIHMYFVIAETSIMHSDNWLVKYVIVAIAVICFVAVLRKVIPSRFWKVIGIN